MGLIDLFDRWISERGSALVQEKHIALIREQLITADKKIASLDEEILRLTSENQTLKTENVNSDKKQSAEILRLLKRTEQLEAELLKYQAKTPKEAEYLQGDDPVPPLAFSVVVDTKGTTETKKLTPTWDYLFYYIGPSMMNECTEEEIMNKAVIAYYNCLSEELRKYTKEDRIVLSSESKNSFLLQFSALGWIEKGTKKRRVSDNARYWRLTSLGETHLKSIGAKKRVDWKEQLNRERAFHGTRWDTVHDGYFSDPDVAAPLVRTVKESASWSNPDKIIDLGGGTGFLLSQLLIAGIPSASLFYVDASPKQIDAAKSTGLAHLYASVDSFLRRDIGSEEARYLFMMRSVLHYFREEGLRQVLRHIRAQAKPGEYFVHQTASFEHTQDANCLNALYKMMRTKKWYPTVAFLRDCLCDEGWEVISVLPASSLRLKHDALKERYSLSEADIHQIRDQLSQNHQASENVFRITDDGFCAFLHYSIYVCTPS